MPTPQTIERFTAHVESGAHADVTMQGNQMPPRVSWDLWVANERKVLARAKSVTSICVQPILVNGDYFVVVRWIFESQWLDGKQTHMEELAYQRWEGERIAQEQFFYDPAQLTPQTPIS